MYHINSKLAIWDFAYQKPETAVKFVSITLNKNRRYYTLGQNSLPFRITAIMMNNICNTYSVLSMYM